ncbi:YceI family protein [Phenylobacterium montanum]|uniref:YceI family protein n=1 Tax=Phenylobacterium montanum TaxID=2823693 RepID=A0A975FW66_9CAUL|nr:YceI family protein [Caulobacter sp. S6]QUD85928.1 YceI family protein [Caulobacter sp. S6]
MTPERYSPIAIALHWIIALLLALQLGLGWRMVGLTAGSVMFAAFQLHKSLGISILMLSLLRLAARLKLKKPDPPAGSVATRLAARGVHAALYGFMIAGPLTGWALVSTARVKVPTRLFGLLPWPHLPLDQAWRGPAEAAHTMLAFVGAGLIVLHLAGAVRHHLATASGGVIGRMAPGISTAAGEDRAALTVAALATLTLSAVFAGPWLVFSRPSAPAIQRAALAAGPAPAAPAPRTADAPSFGRSQTNSSRAGAQLAADDPSPAPVAAWTVEEGGQLGFTARLNGAPVEGRFAKWAGDIRFSPENLPASRIAVRVDLASGSTDDAERDAMLVGPNFLAVADSAEAIFRSRSIKRVGGDRYSAAGALSLHGVSRPVVLDFTLNIRGEEASVSGVTTLDRTTFAVGSGDWASTDQLAAGVQVAFKFKARRQAAPQERPS